MFCHCKNKLELCGCKYFHVSVCIIASRSQQIPGLSRTFNINLQIFQEAWEPWMRSICKREIAEATEHDFKKCNEFKHQTSTATLRQLSGKFLFFQVPLLLAQLRFWRLLSDTIITIWSLRSSSQNQFKLFWNSTNSCSILSLRFRFVHRPVPVVPRPFLKFHPPCLTSTSTDDTFRLQCI